MPSKDITAPRDPLPLDQLGPALLDATSLSQLPGLLTRWLADSVPAGRGELRYRQGPGGTWLGVDLEAAASGSPVGAANPFAAEPAVEVDREPTRATLRLPLEAAGSLIGALVVTAPELSEAQVAELASQRLLLSSTLKRLIQQRTLHESVVRLIEAKEDLEERVAARVAEVEQQRQEIAELSAYKDEVLGIVAHDLRNPIAALLGFSQLLKLCLQTGEDPEALVKDVDNLEMVARSMRTLLDDFLDVQKLQAGRLEIFPQLVSLETVIRRCLRMNRVWADNRSLAMDIELDPGLPRVRLDERRIEQALWNLVANAIKYCPNGGRVVIRGTIEPGPSGDDELVVAVQDSGAGIPEEELARLFDLFQQGARGQEANERGVRGHGLGLVIAHKMITLHGGRIWAENMPTGGARFAFSLPLEHAEV